MRSCIHRLLPLLALAAVLAGCGSDDDHGKPTQENASLDGNYWYVSFDRAVGTTISPDLRVRAGLARADGVETIASIINVGAPLSTLRLPFTLNTRGQLNSAGMEPGSANLEGDCFQIGDLDRTDGHIGWTFFTKQGASLTVNDFVDPGAGSGFYHAVLLQFNRPGITTGTGSATITKNTNSTASWRIDYNLSSSSTLVREGSLLLAPEGAISANDTTTLRTYVGFGEPHGDWVVWMELDTSQSRIYRMDILIRKGKDLTDASLAGRFNLNGFYESTAGSSVDTTFGRIAFNGRDEYGDYTLRNSFGQSATTGDLTYPYDTSSDGRVVFIGGSNPIGFFSRAKTRRLLVFPDVNPAGDPGVLGFFLGIRF
jgi:hypothetical protein